MRSTAIRSLVAAESEFLRAGNNEQLLNDACGAGSKNRHNPALWDAASVRYSPCASFHEAFRACFPRGTWGARTWADLDLATLRACVPGLDLPDWVYAAQADAAALEWVHAGGWADEEQAAWYAEQDAAWEHEVGEEMIEEIAEVIVSEEMIESEATMLRIPPLPWTAWRPACAA